MSKVVLLKRRGASLEVLVAVNRAACPLTKPLTRLDSLEFNAMGVGIRDVTCVVVHYRIYLHHRKEAKASLATPLKKFFLLRIGNCVKNVAVYPLNCLWVSSTILGGGSANSE